MADASNDTQDKLQRYRKIVLQYEQLDEEIDALIMASDGIPENMSLEDRAQYRELARRRDEAQNEMRWLESQLLVDDETE